MVSPALLGARYREYLKYGERGPSSGRDRPVDKETPGRYNTRTRRITAWRKKEAEAAASAGLAEAIGDHSEKAEAVESQLSFDFGGGRGAIVLDDQPGRGG